MVENCKICYNEYKQETLRELKRRIVKDPENEKKLKKYQESKEQMVHIKEFQSQMEQVRRKRERKTKDE